MISLKNFAQKSHLFARMSEAAYQSPEQNRDYFARLGMDYDYLEIASNELYLLHNEHDLVIVFRGTEPSKLPNVLEDLDADMVASQTKTGKVHHGFKRALDNLWPKLLPILKGHLKQQTVWLTGHSLGAAMAVLAANRLHDETKLNIKPAAVFTYGCPRNGDMRFCNSLAVPHFRWVNNVDMVTKLPTFPYWHSGQMFYIDGAGNVKNMSLAGRVVDQLTATMRGLFHGTAIPLADHSISRYAAHLEKYQETGSD